VLVEAERQPARRARPVAMASEIFMGEAWGSEE
jgi:hypothetical protein